MLTSTSPRGAERDTDTRSWCAVGVVVMGGVEDMERILLVEVIAPIGREAVT